MFSTVEGELVRPRNITKAWSRVVPGKGFHSLRHTHASMLINAGVDILTISVASATARRRSPWTLTAILSAGPTKPLLVRSRGYSNETA